MIKMCVAGILALFMTALYADNATNEGDCPIVIPDLDCKKQLLTREECIQLRDQALKDALAQVQDCRQRLSDVQKQNNSNSNNSNGSGNASTGTNGNAEQADSTESEQSDTQNKRAATPSSELSGSEVSDDPNEQANTQIPGAATPSGELSGSEFSDNKDTISGSPEDSPPTLPTSEDNKQTSNNGKLPEDIPPADNDGIIAKQIREAALAEPDPQKRAKLWNTYRLYKGIPE